MKDDNENESISSLLLGSSMESIAHINDETLQERTAKIQEVLHHIEHSIGNGSDGDNNNNNRAAKSRIPSVTQEDYDAVSQKLTLQLQQLQVETMRRHILKLKTPSSSSSNKKNHNNKAMKVALEGLAQMQQQILLQQQQQDNNNNNNSNNSNNNAKSTAAMPFSPVRKVPRNSNARHPDSPTSTAGTSVDSRDESFGTLEAMEVSFDTSLSSSHEKSLQQQQQQQKSSSIVSSLLSSMRWILMSLPLMLFHGVYSLFVSKSRKDKSYTTSEDMNHSTDNDDNRNESTSQFSFVWNCLRLIRTLVFHLPLALLGGSILAAYCIRDLHVTYFVPLVETFQWNQERKVSEITYYFRECDARDLSTSNPLDLILPLDATPEQANRHMMKHGNSIYRNVLQPDTATKMREYVLQRNAVLSDTGDAIPLIGQKQRWSFPMSPTEDAMVAQMTKEIATHPTLRPAMDVILGPDAAMVELTAITSAYGAPDQHWHSDAMVEGGAMNYARSFVPMYSLFIPLQDTTPAMGATDTCPGTHFCSNPMTDICTKHGMRITNSQNRTHDSDNDNNNVINDKKYAWKMGDGAMMNLASYHRGPAHVESAPNSERVMLIITFSPRPRPSKYTGFDRRTISLGTSYSNRWDNWGFTLDDFAHPSWHFVWPLHLVKAFRLWNQGTPFGHDFLSIVAARIGNGQMAYGPEDLEALLERLRQTTLGRFVLGPDSDDDDQDDYDSDWMTFLNRTTEDGPRKVKELYCICLATTVVTVLLIRLIQGLLQSRTGSTSAAASSSSLGKKNYLLRNFVWNFLWTHALVCSIVLAVYVTFISTPWVKHVRSNDHPSLESPYIGDFSFPLLESKSEHEGPSTLVSKFDVLFNTRYHDKEFLTHNNEFVDHHPGNAFWRRRVEEVAPYYNNIAAAAAATTASSSSSLSSDTHNDKSGSGILFAKFGPWDMKSELVSTVVKDVHNTTGRFLVQGRFGQWMLMENDFALEETRRALLGEGRPHTLKRAYELLKEMTSKQIYGMELAWDTDMKQVHTPRLLFQLETLLFPPEEQEQQVNNNRMKNKKKKTTRRLATFSEEPTTTTLSWSPIFTSSMAMAAVARAPITTVPPARPAPKIYYSVGEPVEFYHRDFQEYVPVTIIGVRRASGTYNIVFESKDEESQKYRKMGKVPPSALRSRQTTFVEGEEVTSFKNGKVMTGVVTQANARGRLDIWWHEGFSTTGRDVKKVKKVPVVV